VSKEKHDDGVAAANPKEDARGTEAALASRRGLRLLKKQQELGDGGKKRG
jgi:hypothetical protein